MVADLTRIYITVRIFYIFKYRLVSCPRVISSKKYIFCIKHIGKSISWNLWHLCKFLMTHFKAHQYNFNAKKNIAVFSDEIYSFWTFTFPLLLYYSYCWLLFRADSYSSTSKKDTCYKYTFKQIPLLIRTKCSVLLRFK